MSSTSTISFTMSEYEGSSSYLTSEEEEGEEESVGVEDKRQGPWVTNGFSRYIGSRFPFFDVTVSFWDLI
jgi:hypothetical protein